MESLESALEANGETLQTSRAVRLPKRHGLSMTAGVNDKAFMDLGESNFKVGYSGASSGTRKPMTTYTSRSKGQRSNLSVDSDSSSPDELDSLSQSDTHSPTKKSVQKFEEDFQDGPVENEYVKRSRERSDVMKNLHFRKNKNQGKTQPEASSSKAPPSKENESRAVRDTGTFSKRSLASKATKPRFDNCETSRPLGDKSPNRQLSPPPSHKPPREKPKPRPIKKPEATTVDAAPKTTKKPNILTVKKPHFPLPVKRAPSEVEHSRAMHSEPGIPSRTRLPEQFPFLSPTSQRTPRVTPSSTTAEKFPLSPPKSRVDEFPVPSPLALDDRGKKIAPSAFLMPSPQSFAASSKGKALAVSAEDDEEDEDGSYGRKSNGTRPEPFPMNTQMLRRTSSPSVQLSQAVKRNSDGIRSDGAAKKRRKDDEDDMLSSLPDDYALEDDDDTLFMSPCVDPKTLCPYCDTPLPTSPTPLLRSLLAKVCKKSSPDPRPANPLGRKAPLATFIAVCQRHRFESQILPEAEQKGWPKTIDWAKVGGRVEAMRDSLQALINDRDDDNGEEFFSATGGPRSKCVFWRDVVSEVKQKGSRAVAGVRGQFANFEKTQPGYYGELGSVIIHQTLYNLFPPSELDPDLLSPLTSNEFIQRVLVPEVAVRLIKEDQNLKGDVGTNKALQILRESSAYGVAMFPEDSGELACVGPSRGSRGQRQEDDMGAGDLIVMERARKRRKELEEEDEHEEEAEEQDRRRIESRGRSTQKGKTKTAIQEEDSGSDVVFVPQKPKPKPRPTNKSSSSGNPLGNTDVEDEVVVSEREAKIPKRKTSNATLMVNGNVKSQRPKRSTAKKFPLDVDSAADSTDTDSSSRSNSSPRYRSPSANETRHQSVRASPTSSPPLVLKKRPQTRTKTSSKVNLYSTSGSEGDRSDSSRTRRGRKIKKVESFTDIAVDSLEIKDDNDFYDDHYIKTPVAKRDRRSAIEITNDDTPKPARSPPSRVPPALPAASESSTTKPLELARLRRQGKQAKDLTREPLRKASLEPPWVRSMLDAPRNSDESFTSTRTPTPLGRREFGWLLNDSSQSSSGSW